MRGYPKGFILRILIAGVYRRKKIDYKSIWNNIWFTSKITVLFSTRIKAENTINNLGWEEIYESLKALETKQINILGFIWVHFVVFWFFFWFFFFRFCFHFFIFFIFFFLFFFFFFTLIFFLTIFCACDIWLKLVPGIKRLNVVGRKWPIYQLYHVCFALVQHGK